MGRDVNMLVLTKRSTTENKISVVQYGKKFPHIHFNSGLVVFI